MRKISLFLILVLMLTQVVSCVPSFNTTAAELMQAITDEYKNIPPCRAELLYGADRDSRAHMSDTLAGIIYYGKKMESVPELLLLSDFAVRLPDNQSAFEIHILKVKNLSNRGEIVEMCQRRIDMLQKSDVHLYVPEAYEQNINGATIITKGNYVILLATPNNNKAINAIENKI